MARANEMMLSRNAVVDALELALRKAEESARLALDELSSSLSKETKSTVGDKHETGRAMVQREMEQAGERLARCEAMQSAFVRLDMRRKRSAVGPGTILVSGDARLLIGIGFGPFEVPELGRFQAISADAPIAQALAGSRVEEWHEFRGRRWTVESLT